MDATKMADMNVAMDSIASFKEDMLGFKNHFMSVIGEVKFVEDVGSVIEYSSDGGVLFTVDVMDEEGQYLFNFGDASYHVTEEVFDTIKEMVDKQLEEIVQPA